MPKSSSSSKKAAPPKEEKEKIVARNLLRLYQFLNEDQPITQEDILVELDLNTPNETLRNETSSLKLEMESVYEENQALRQNLLQNQIENEDQMSAYQLEIQDLNEKLKMSAGSHKEETIGIIEKYEEKISALNSDLNSSLEKNQKITEVNEAIDQLQEKATELFRKKEKLNRKNRNLTNQLDEKEGELVEVQKQLKISKKKQNELEKKIDLQTMVIDGYKRKEKR